VWFNAEARQGKQVRNVSTEALLSALWHLPESQWIHYYGRHLTDVDLATLLKPYGVGPRVVKVSTNKTKRGYKRDALYDVWSRYVPEP